MEAFVLLLRSSGQDVVRSAKRGAAGSPPCAMSPWPLPPGAAPQRRR